MINQTAKVIGGINVSISRLPREEHKENILARILESGKLLIVTESFANTNDFGFHFDFFLAVEKDNAILEILKTSGRLEISRKILLETYKISFMDFKTIPNT